MPWALMLPRRPRHASTGRLRSVLFAPASPEGNALGHLRVREGVLTCATSSDCPSLPSEAINVRDRPLPLLAARVMCNAAMRVRENTLKANLSRRIVGSNTIEGRCMVVVYCCPAPEVTRIISFKKATDRERKKLEAVSL